MAVVINQELCRGCKTCIMSCPFQAIDFDEANRKAVINGTCKTCSFCIPKCPFKAIEKVDEKVDWVWIPAMGAAIGAMAGLIYMLYNYELFGRLTLLFYLLIFVLLFGLVGLIVFGLLALLVELGLDIINKRTSRVRFEKAAIKHGKKRIRRVAEATKQISSERSDIDRKVVRIQELRSKSLDEDDIFVAHAFGVLISCIEKTPKSDTLRDTLRSIHSLKKEELQLRSEISSFADKFGDIGDFTNYISYRSIAEGHEYDKAELPQSLQMAEQEQLVFAQAKASSRRRFLRMLVLLLVILATIAGSLAFKAHRENQYNRYCEIIISNDSTSEDISGAIKGLSLMGEYKNASDVICQGKDILNKQLKYEEAIAFINSGDYQKATKSFNSLPENYRDSTTLYLMIAEILLTSLKNGFVDYNTVRSNLELFPSEIHNTVNDRYYDFFCDISEDLLTHLKNGEFHDYDTFRLSLELFPLKIQNAITKQHYELFYDHAIKLMSTESDFAYAYDWLEAVKKANKDYKNTNYYLSFFSYCYGSIGHDKKNRKGTSLVFMPLLDDSGNIVCEFHDNLDSQTTSLYILKVETREVENKLVEGIFFYKPNSRKPVWYKGSGSFFYL